MKIRKNILDSMAVAGVAAFYFSAVLPISTFWANSDVFFYGTGDLLLDLWLRFLAMVILGSAVLFILGLFCGRFFHLMVLAVVVAAIVEAGPLSIGLPELNGVLEGYQSNIRSVVDAQIIVAIFLAAVLSYRMLRQYVVLIVTALFVYSCAMLFDTKIKESAAQPIEGISSDALIPRLEVVQSVEYSAKGNVMLLILDSISVDVARDVFAIDEKLRDSFRGFVNYIDNLGMHWFTTVAIPAIMTGRYYSHASELSTYGQAAFAKDSLIQQYISQDQPVYVNIAPGIRGYTNRRKSEMNYNAFRPVDSCMEGIIPWDIDQLCLFRICPYFLKSSYIIKSTLGALNPGELNSEKQQVNVNVDQDDVLWNILSSRIVNPHADRTLNVHYARGGHLPICYDADGNRIACEKPGYVEYLGHCQHALRLLGGYLDALRSNGTYDNSTIIVTSDHGINISKPGVDLRGLPQAAFPFLMVKPAKSTEPYRESSLPTSHTQIAPLAIALSHNALDIGSIEKILRCGDRMCRFSSSGKVREWTIRADGCVDSRTYDDSEPRKEELRPLESGRIYSFHVSTAGENYPDFILENGARNSSVGIHVVGNRAGKPMRLTVNTGKPGGKVRFILNTSCRRENHVVASVNGRTRELVGKNDWTRFSVVFDPVEVDESGFVDFAFNCSRTDGSFAVRSIEMEDSTAILNSISIAPEQKKSNWRKASTPLQNGVSYEFSADGVVVEAGTTEAVEAILYNSENKKFCLRKRFDVVDGQSKELYWKFTVPKEDGNYCVLVYAGVAGKCENIGATWKNVVVNKSSQLE